MDYEGDSVFNDHIAEINEARWEREEEARVAKEAAKSPKTGTNRTVSCGLQGRHEDCNGTVLLPDPRCYCWCHGLCEVCGEDVQYVFAGAPGTGGAYYCPNNHYTKNTIRVMEPWETI